MNDLHQRIAEDRDRIVDELGRLVTIPSVGYEGYDPAHVRAGAGAAADILRDAGLADVRLVELDGGHPAVFGQHEGPDGAPTVLLYAHHDVQPAADPDEWAHPPARPRPAPAGGPRPPFEPTEIDGRLFGRGSADDKCGIAIHAAAIRSLLADGEPPVSIKVLVEGEEECSTEHLPALVQGNADLLRADVAVVADSGNIRTGVPTITTSVRGATSLEVRVDVLPQAVHSGAFGGPLPDAISALARMIASLHTDNGEVAVEGLHAFAWEGDEITEDAFRAETNVFPEIQLFGSGSIADRTLSQPSINVLAFDAPRVSEVANQIVPTTTAVIGLRMAPGEDHAKARQSVADHMRAAAPWGVRVSINHDEPGAGHIVDTSSTAFTAVREALIDAFDHDVVEIGSGGSIPLVPLLVDTFPEIQIVMWGAADDRSNYHSRD